MRYCQIIMSVIIVLTFSQEVLAEAQEDKKISAVSVIERTLQMYKPTLFNNKAKEFLDELSKKLFCWINILEVKNENSRIGRWNWLGF